MSPAGMLEAAIAGRPVRVHQFAEATREDHLHNKDVAAGLALATLADAPQHRAFNLGSGHGFTDADIAEAIRRVVPDARIELVPVDARLAQRSPTEPTACSTSPARRPSSATGHDSSHWSGHSPTSWLKWSECGAS